MLNLKDRASVSKGHCRDVKICIEMVDRTKDSCGDQLEGAADNEGSHHDLRAKYAQLDRDQMNETSK